jgi:dienelactone hydrolase
VTEDLRALDVAVLVVLEPARSAEYSASVKRELGPRAHVHPLTPAARESDREGLAELERALEAARDTDEPALVVGVGRGGTLAFLLACQRRVTAVVDVEGALLHATLSHARPVQPLELALNLEGAFLGLFGATGAVGERERELIRQRLAGAAKDFELATLPGGEIVVDPAHSGYDGARAGELWRRVRAFLRARLAAELEP